MKRHEAIARLKALEEEFRATEFAIADALQRALVDPAPLLRYELSPADLRRAEQRVEATYVVRLFAEFEVSVRGYLRTVKRTHPPMRGLIDGVVARRRSIPPRLHGDMHDVRRYRNGLLHGPLGPPAWRIEDCRSVLCRFLAHLPEEW